LETLNFYQWAITKRPMGMGLKESPNFNRVIWRAIYQLTFKKDLELLEGKKGWKRF